MYETKQALAPDFDYKSQLENKINTNNDYILYSFKGLYPSTDLCIFI